MLIQSVISRSDGWIGEKVWAVLEVWAGRRRREGDKITTCYIEKGVLQKDASLIKHCGGFVKTCRHTTPGINGGDLLELSEAEARK